MFAKGSAVSSGREVIGTRLHFDKAPKVFYDLGHLNLHEMSEGHLRMRHKKLQILLHIYFSFTFSIWTSAANFYMVKGYEEQRCQFGRNYQNLNFFWFLREFLLLFEKIGLVTGHVGEAT